MAHTEAAQLLAVWEEGLPRTAAGRAWTLHRAACPPAGTEELLAVPVGERERDLYVLRRELFGDLMQVRLECSACAEAMEFELDAGELVQRFGTSPPEETLRVAANGWEVDFRLPAVADLDAVAASGPDPESARDELLARCVVAARRDGEDVPSGRLLALLPDAVLARLAAAASEADPAAEVTLDIACPACGAVTPAELDIASYLWTELDAWARDVLLDVHLLATAYGWTEPEVLALSPTRRRHYLELCADV